MSISINSIGQQLSMEGRVQTVGRNGIASEDVEMKVFRRPAQTVETAKPPVDLPQGRKIYYNVNQDLNRVIVKIVDAKTDKVIEEIPSVEMQKFIARFDTQIGLLLDKKV